MLTRQRGKKQDVLKVENQFSFTNFHFANTKFLFRYFEDYVSEL